MKEEYLNNARKHGEKINQYVNQILYALCEIIWLITGKECSYDLLFNGNVIFIREGEKNIIYENVIMAINGISNIIDTLYK